MNATSETRPETLARCTCPYCAGRIKYASEDHGRQSDCPHCGRPVLLMEGVATGLAAVTVRTSPTVTVLYVLAGLEALGGLFGLFSALTGEMANAGIIFIAGAVSCVMTIALAELLAATQTSAERLARLEVHLRSLKND
jgi:DNA-directed RNA polymerase subunit RPC12/RpoP